MNPIVVEREADAQGVVRVELPLGAGEAGRRVRVTVTLLPQPMSQEEWHRVVNELAGSWEGDFERPSDPPPVERESLG